MSAAPGPLSTPLLSFSIPARLDSRDMLNLLRDRHGFAVKMVPKRWLNGIRLSPHLFNTADEADRLLEVLRRELI